VVFNELAVALARMDVNPAKAPMRSLPSGDDVG
jgi:hypothetical protein